MNTDARVSARSLTKVFSRRAVGRVKGVATEGPAALRHLVQQTLRPTSHRIQPRRDKHHTWALDDVNFDVAPGEVLGIIGRNGAGKSTLLKILARVLHPTTGSVTIRGGVVSMLELGIGFAPELTVRENLQIYGRLAGISGRTIHDAEDAILAFARLSGYREIPLAACPSGSNVRLGFAAVVGLGADIILADEVLAVGDSSFRHACEERVRAAGASGESVLFVSHDMAAIRRICTRVIWIDQGRIVQAGPTEDVVGAYTSELLAGRLLPPLQADGLAATCVLLDLRLLDDELAPVGALQLTEPGYIDCVFRLTRPDVAAMVEFELWQGKHHVLTSTAPQAITARSTKTFSAGVRIPAHFLNEQNYQARCRIVVADVNDASTPPVLAAEERMDIMVMNSRPDESVWKDWAWGRSGLISPKLAWNVEQVHPEWTRIRT